MESIEAEAICTSCGACCAYFRVSFYWGETDTHPQGYVPAEFTERLNDRHAVMRGTDRVDPKCVCLEGTVGLGVRCSIYPLRPTPCREFDVHQPSVPNEACTRARAAFGLPPLFCDDDFMPPEISA